MARAATGLGVRELAEAAQVSADTIVRFEKGDELRPRTVAAIRAALEAAGVIFVEENGEGPGVRLKKEGRLMTQDEFLSKLKLYDELHLRAKGIHVQGAGVPVFPGYSFVYTKRDRVDLMAGGKSLGTAVWRDGRVVFDPALTLPVKDRPFEEDIEEWLSRAECRRTAAGL
jgi:transcriptional regulator with XRE-family HTH domain